MSQQHCHFEASRSLRLSALFYQECTVKDGRIEQTNFGTYNSMRIAEMPKVESDHHAVGRHCRVGQRG